ncbi:TfoX/Sxy family protein [Lutibaculum baratangense]|uniref:TfoX domain protein n=1 Tax=Lutibaculum baratangense AMV1 TaxID=631454 RepID=V4QUJ5_9HYPH|nr:TfoX/Sxy family protein [Lutibaculum baratangense]ESR23402.1 TfoX domain protein [Lutibaculum baratangense AMV1]
MAVSPQFRPHVVDLLMPLGPIDTKRMFGGLSVRCAGRHFAVVIDDTLYLTSDEALRAELMARGGSVFTYAKRDRIVEAPRLVSVVEDLLEDPEALLPFARRSLEFATSGPGAVRPRSPRASA